MATQTTTHQADALDRLPERHKNKTKLAALLNACTDETQNIENALWQLASERSLDIAEGEQLDVIGRILNQDRATTSDDDEYRELLRVRILVNRSSGSVPDLVRIVQALAPTASVELIQNYPASFTVWLDDVEIDDATATLIADLLSEAKAAGIGAQVVSLSEENDFSFRTALTTLTTALYDYASDSRIHVESTEGFPESGPLVFKLHDSDELIVKYTSKTATSFEGVSSQAGTEVNQASGSMVYAPSVAGLSTNDVSPASTSLELDFSEGFPDSGFVVVGTQASASDYLLFSYNGKSTGNLLSLTNTGIGSAASVGKPALVTFCGKGFSDDVPTANLGGDLSKVNEA
jgi:hypothetical protein